MLESSSDNAMWFLPFNVVVILVVLVFVNRSAFIAFSASHNVSRKRKKTPPQLRDGAGGDQTLGSLLAAIETVQAVNGSL